MSRLTHIDESGQPTMVDIGDKAVTRRQATARVTVTFPDSVAHLLEDGELITKKGPVGQAAIIAGVMAAKRTHELIPFCHPLGIERCSITVAFEDRQAIIESTVAVEHKTGVEMEALTGASVAALTVYDMCKALSHHIVIGPLELVAKSGGKRDVGEAPP